MTLSGRATAADRLTAEGLPALVAAVGEMSPPAAREAEWGLAAWLRSLAGALSGRQYVEWLQDKQSALDALTECERVEYDLTGYRARLLVRTHAEFDERR